MKLALESAKGLLSLAERAELFKPKKQEVFLRKRKNS